MMNKNELGPELPHPLEPRGQFPSTHYIAKIATVYAAIAGLSGILMFVAIVVYSFPMDIAVFLAGIAFAIIAIRLWRSRVVQAATRHLAGVLTRIDAVYR